MDAEFAKQYQQLSEEGACDGYGASESDRVYREWVDAGRPQPVAEFIRRRANIGPEAAA